MFGLNCGSCPTVTYCSPVSTVSDIEKSVLSAIESKEWRLRIFSM